MVKVNDCRVVLNENQISFPHLLEPYSYNGGEAKYSVCVLIDKDNKEAIDAIEQAVDNAINAGLSKFGGKKPDKTKIKLPLNDGDERDDEAFQGKYYLNANSKLKPQVVTKDFQPIEDPTEIYGGCYAKVSLTFYAFNSAGNRGVAAGLGNVMKTRDGEHFGGFTSAEDDFSDDDDMLD